MNNQEWIYSSYEYKFLKNKKAEGIEYKNFDEFWGGFNTSVKSFMVTDDNTTKEEIEKFRLQLKNNAEEIYKVFCNV